MTSLSKTQLIIFIIALGLLGGFLFFGSKTTTPKQDLAVEQAVWPSREVEKIPFAEETEYLTITAQYPKTASDAITTYFKSFTDEQVAQFKQDTSWVETAGEYAPSAKLSLDISYTEAWSKTVHTYIFSVNLYTGGAHGMQVRKTFAFNQQGQLLTISNLFSNGLDGLASFSKLVQAELLKREGVEKDWVRDGASPKEENYKSFVVTDEGITVLFDPYQVAPYAFGTVDITIPKEAFMKTANPVIFPPIITL